MGKGFASALGVLLALGGFAQPVAARERAPHIDVTVKSPNQARILDSERIRVRAGVTPAGFSNPDTIFKGKGETAKNAKRVVKRKRATLPRQGSKVVTLRLSRLGKRRLAKCVPQEIVVSAKPGPRAEISLSGEGRADLTLTLPRCDGATSTRTYELDPPSDATHANDTPRSLRTVGTGGETVRIALFACGAFAESGEDLAFTPAGGVADRGSPAGTITTINGFPNGDGQEVSDPIPNSNGVEFEISGSDGCAAPIVFRDLNSNGSLDVDSEGIPTERYGGGGTTTWEPQGVAFENADRCDPLDPAVCLQPFPTDHFTRTEPSTDTGKRVDFDTRSMPANRLGTHIEATEWNRNDGFSPGQMVSTRVPGLDSREAFDQTGAVPITDVERSFDVDAPIAVIDADSGERHLIWSEIDGNPANPADVNLLIRPAVNWEEGHRYIVALRDLRRADGSVIEPGRAFQLYRDRIITSDSAVEARRGRFEENFATLAEAGIARDDLYLAWDFTVASERSLSERILSIRDGAFAQLGDTNLADVQVQGQTPGVFITGVTDYEPCGNDGCQGGSPLFEALPLPIGADDLPVAGSVIGPTQAQLSTILGDPPEDDRIARQVEGQIVVPCYTNLPGCQTGTQFAYSGPDDNIPNRLLGNQTLANFICRIPRSAVEGLTAGPVKPSLYGHGLLGGAGEVRAGNVAQMGNDHGFMFCATDWAGFATQDIPTIGLILQDLNNFPKLTDRSQQGFLNFMFLGRAMIHPQGFSSSPAFRFGGQSIINTERLFYDGNSQGGILGGSLVAVAPDLQRGVLGVPGMNYSTLLRRSSDFAPYAEGDFIGAGDSDLGLYDNYPNELERPLILSLIQMLWDRGEMNGYAHHLSGDPLANTPDHEVLMQVAFGDHQVSMWTAEVAARTMGAYANPAPLDPGRHPDVQPLFGIPRIDAFPYDGSALIYVDSGTPAPPITNTPPNDQEHGDDPHGRPRADAEAQAQKAAFLSIEGKVIDTCGGSPCYAGGYTGPP